MSALQSADRTPSGRLMEGNGTVSPLAALTFPPLLSRLISHRVHNWLGTILTAMLWRRGRRRLGHRLCGAKASTESRAPTVRRRGTGMVTATGAGSTQFDVGGKIG